MLTATDGSGRRPHWHAEMKSCDVDSWPGVNVTRSQTRDHPHFQISKTNNLRPEVLGPDLVTLAL